MWPFKSNPPRTTNPELWERRDEELIRELIRRGYVRPYKKAERKRRNANRLTLEPGEVGKGKPQIMSVGSTRHMSDWPTVFRESGLVERICPHGVGHPDPDFMARLRETDPEKAAVLGIHGCDGCCNTPATEPEVEACYPVQ